MMVLRWTEFHDIFALLKAFHIFLLLLTAILLAVVWRRNVIWQPCHVISYVSCFQSTSFLIYSPPTYFYSFSTFLSFSFLFLGILVSDHIIQYHHSGFNEVCRWWESFLIVHVGFSSLSCSPLLPCLAAFSFAFVSTVDGSSCCQNLLPATCDQCLLCVSYISPTAGVYSCLVCGCDLVEYGQGLLCLPHSSPPFFSIPHSSPWLFNGLS